MQKRAGVTRKISVSLAGDDLAALKKRANRLYRGNVSAVIAELAADAKLLEGMTDLVAWLGGPTLTDEDRRAIDRELRGDGRTTKKRAPHSRATKRVKPRTAA